MKRTVSLLLALCLCFCLCACGESRETVSMYDLRVEMLSAAGKLPDMLSASSSDDNANSSFSYISDMDYDKVEAYFVSYANELASYEIAVIAVKDASDVSVAADSLKQHAQNRVDFYRSYGVSEVPRAENALVFTDGRYAVLIMTDSNSAVRSAFDDFVN